MNMQDNHANEKDKELYEELNRGYADEVWGEEYIKEMLYDDEIPPKKKGFLNYWRKTLIIDFEKPFSGRDQFVIMVVMLCVSAALFSAVYLAAFLSGGHYAGENNAAAEITNVPYADDELSQCDVASHNSASEVSQEGAEQKDNTSPMGTTKSITISNDRIHYGHLILVDKECKCVYDGENVVPVTDGSTDSYAVTDYNVSLDKEVIGHLNEMLDDFCAIYGKTDIMIACGYRSFSTQVELYRDEVEQVGEEKAELLVAQPGFSEHQTGFAFDLNLNIETGEGGIKYEGSDIYSWINENCSKYGFIIRYPKGKEQITGYSYEPWHFRYVGKIAARYMSSKGLTLEEFIEMLHETSVKKPLKLSGGSVLRYIYYVRADDSGSTKIPIPKGFGYEVSGDNYSGFIVTVVKKDGA